jgi:membrane associated rhomboid family serine protease
MPFSDRSYNRPYIRSLFPQAVKWLLISNIALFVLYFLAVRAGYAGVFEPFGLVPGDVLFRGALWQFVTYLFLHDPFGFGHILINMLMLWMFGMDLERDWGSRFFLKFYFLCGVGAAICVVLGNLLFSGTLNTRTIGASGAIYGILMAFGMLYPDRPVLMMLLFPIPAKYFVMIMGGIAFLSSIGASGSGVSHVAHLGGMIFGFVYLRRLRARRLPKHTTFIGDLRNKWAEFKRHRARRKFEVYMKKHDRNRDRDRFVH